MTSNQTRSREKHTTSSFWTVLKKSTKPSSQGFTLVEVMTGIVVFSIGMLGIYLLVDAGISSAQNAKIEIVASNILREQVELLKNTRDSNWLMLRLWDKTWKADGTTTGWENSNFSWGQYPQGSNQTLSGYYMIENNFEKPSMISGEEFQYDLSTTNPMNGIFAIKVRQLPIGMEVIPEDIVKGAFDITPNGTRLCQDFQGRYTHNCYISQTKTPFVSFYKIEPVSVGGINTPEIISVSAYVGTLHRGVKLYEIRTLLTNWKR